MNEWTNERMRSFPGDSEQTYGFVLRSDAGGSLSCLWRTAVLGQLSGAPCPRGSSQTPRPSKSCARVPLTPLTPLASSPRPHASVIESSWVFIIWAGCCMLLSPWMQSGRKPRQWGAVLTAPASPLHRLGWVLWKKVNSCLENQGAFNGAGPSSRGSLWKRVRAASGLFSRLEVLFELCVFLGEERFQLRLLFEMRRAGAQSARMHQGETKWEQTIFQSLWSPTVATGEG